MTNAPYEQPTGVMAACLEQSAAPRLPDPREKNPVILSGGRRDPATVFLRNLIDHPSITIGEYTYYNDQTLPTDYAATLAPYLFRGAPERLVIGRFCQIAEGVKFITATANHDMRGFSTYPFAVFDADHIGTYRHSMPRGRDTTIGHDCWLGRDAMLLPGAELGNGVIVGAGSVVRGRVPDYAIVSGNLAQRVRMRFCAETVARLLELGWWDWPATSIARATNAIVSADIARLEALAP